MHNLDEIMPEPVNQIKSNLLTTDIFFFLLKSWNVFHELVAHGPLMLDHRPQLQGHDQGLHRPLTQSLRRSVAANRPGTPCQRPVTPIQHPPLKRHPTKSHS